MKNGLIIFLLLFNVKLFAQSFEGDTLVQLSVSPVYHVLDSTSISSLPHLNQSSSYYFYGFIPNCATLNLKENKWYYNQDTIPYCGECVVWHKFNSVASSLNYWSKYQYGFSFEHSTWISADRIKIVSSYNNGKRHGSRNYYNLKSELIKTENYENGVLKETINNN